MIRRWSAFSVSGRAAMLAIGVTAVLGVVAGPAPAAAQSGLLGQWRFDEPDGQRVIDDGPHALTGFLGTSDGADAADPVRVPGASGGALHFDGDRFVHLPDSASLAASTLTVEAVVRAGTSPGAWRYLVSRGGHGCVAGSYGLYTGAAGGVALYVFDGTRYVVSATAQPPACGTAPGITSRAPSTAARCGSSWTAARSASRWTHRCGSTTPGRRRACPSGSTPETAS